MICPWPTTESIQSELRAEGGKQRIIAHARSADGAVTCFSCRRELWLQGVWPLGCSDPVLAGRVIDDLEALAEGRGPEEVRTHLRGCVGCSLLVRVLAEFVSCARPAQEPSEPLWWLPGDGDLELALHSGPRLESGVLDGGHDDEPSVDFEPLAIPGGRTLRLNLAPMSRPSHVRLTLVLDGDPKVQLAALTDRTPVPLTWDGPFAEAALARGRRYVLRSAGWFAVLDVPA